jgi:hypothetical protein
MLKVYSQPYAVCTHNKLRKIDNLIYAESAPNIVKPMLNIHLTMCMISISLIYLSAKKTEHALNFSKLENPT